MVISLAGSPTDIRFLHGAILHIDPWSMGLRAGYESLVTGDEISGNTSLTDFILAIINIAFGNFFGSIISKVFQFGSTAYPRFNQCASMQLL
jgi:hypothetical protein